MPRFKVHLQQYVERVTTVEVEADDESAAVIEAKSKASRADWVDGDDAYAVDVYAVHDGNGNIVWER